MTLVEGRAQLSEFWPGFDYWDKDSELTYAIEHGDFEKLDILQDYILEDPNRIEDVLESEEFSFIKEDILKQWFNGASEAQYQKK